MDIQYIRKKNSIHSIFKWIKVYTLRVTKDSPLKVEGLLSATDFSATIGKTLVFAELYVIPPAIPAPIKAATNNLLPVFLVGSWPVVYWRKPAKACFYFYALVYLFPFFFCLFIE